MAKRPVEILLVEQDADLAEIIDDALHEVMSVQVTYTDSVDEVLREERSHKHDLVIVNWKLADGDGLELLRQLRISNQCPVILTGDKPTVEQTIEAVRLGARDILVKPFDPVVLAESARAAVRIEMIHRRQRSRYRRLRILTGRIIRERRDLKDRIELICQDVVRAYRRLAQKVVESNVTVNE